MGRRYRGGFLTPNPPALGIPPNTYGVTNLSQEFQARGQTLWPVGPNAPTIVATYPGDSQVAVTFTPSTTYGYPNSMGSYYALATPGNITGNVSSTSPVAVTGLTNGVSYTVQIVPLNSGNVTGTYSSASSVTPAAPNYYVVSFSNSPNVNGAQGTVGYDSYNDKLYVSLNSTSGAYAAVARLSGNSFATDYTTAFTAGTGGQFYAPIYNQTANNITFFSYIPAQDSCVFASSTALANGTSTSWNRSYSISYDGKPNTAVTYGAGQWYGHARDVSGNGYIVGRVASTPYDSAGFVFKIDTSGVPVSGWKFGNTTTGSGEYSNLSGVAVDSDGNVYCVGGITTSSVSGGLLVKFNSSGSVVWQKVFSDTVSNSIFNFGSQKPIVIDSSGNIYVVAGNYGSTNSELFKFDSSGTLLWARKYAWGSAASGSGVTVDFAGNVYIMFMAYVGTGANASRLVTVKYNSSGVIQWQRYWSTSATSYTNFFINYGITIVSLLDSALVYGCTGNDASTSGYPTYFKVPQDGSHTGAYTVRGITYTYAAGSGTDSAVSTSNVDNTFFPTWGAATASSVSLLTLTSSTFSTSSTSTTI
mgnify:CR=1 FL=1